MRIQTCGVKRELFERNYAMANAEFDRLRKEMHERMAVLTESVYRDLSAQVQAAWERVKQAETVFNKHRQDHGC